MPQQILIKDGYVELIESRVLRTVSLEEFRQICNERRLVTPILPFGTIHYQVSESKRDQLFVVAREAHLHKLNYLDAEYPVACPHLLFIIRIRGEEISQIRSFSAFSMPESMDHILLHAPFPNRHSNGDLCLANLFTLPPSRSMIHRIDNAVEQILMTRHNRDLIADAYAAAPEEFRQSARDFRVMLRAWAQWTADNPDWWPDKITKLHWPQARRLKEYTVLDGVSE